MSSQGSISKTLQKHLRWLNSPSTTNDDRGKSKTFPDADKYYLNNSNNRNGKRNAIQNHGNHANAPTGIQDKFYQKGKAFVRRNATKALGIKKFVPPKPLNRAPKKITASKKQHISVYNTTSENNENNRNNIYKNANAGNKYNEVRVPPRNENPKNSVIVLDDDDSELLSYKQPADFCDNSYDSVTTFNNYSNKATEGMFGDDDIFANIDVDKVVADKKRSQNSTHSTVRKRDNGPINDEDFLLDVDMLDELERKAQQAVQRKKNRNSQDSQREDIVSIGSTNSSQYGEQNMGTNGEGINALNLELRKLEKRRQQDAAAAMKFLERAQNIPSAIVNRIPKTASRIKAVKLQIENYNTKNNHQEQGDCNDNFRENEGNYENEGFSGSSNFKATNVYDGQERNTNSYAVEGSSNQNYENYSHSNNPYENLSNTSNSYQKEVSYEDNAQYGNSYSYSSYDMPAGGAGKDEELGGPQNNDYYLEHKLKKHLFEIYGFRNFRDGQLRTIMAAMRGRDAFSIMPTGQGKSLTYQLPGILNRGITIVISPLLSLVQDQVDSINVLQDGKCAVFLNSTQDEEVSREIYKQLYKCQPNFKFLFVTPEKVASSGSFSNVLDKLESKGLIARIVIDEAHCVSQWGHDYRPDYLKLNIFKERWPSIPDASPHCNSDSKSQRGYPTQLTHE